MILLLLKHTGGPLWKWMPMKFGKRIEKRAFIVGIVSRGLGCARKDSPGVYTRTKKYIKWMYKYIKKHSCSNPHKKSNRKNRARSRRKKNKKRNKSTRRKKKKRLRDKG